MRYAKNTKQANIKRIRSRFTSIRFEANKFLKRIRRTLTWTPIKFFTGLDPAYSSELYVTGFLIGRRMYVYFLSSATSRIYLAFMRTFIVCHVVLNNCWGDGWDPDPWNQDTDPRIRIHIYIYIIIIYIYIYIFFFRIRETLHPRLPTHFAVFTRFEGISEMPIFWNATSGRTSQF
jgi:hypothetical protein